MNHRFGAFEIDDRLLELRRNGKAAFVQARVLDTILFLIRHRDEVVSKAALIDGPWGGTAVGDAALSQAIRSARKVLSAAGEPPAIATIRGRGFRFVRPITVQPEEGNSTAGARPPLFGRARELDVLDQAFARAKDRRGGLVVVRGAAGIGKTRLVEAFAERLKASGAKVLWGHCWPEGRTPALWPWSEALGDLQPDLFEGWRSGGGPPAADSVARLLFRLEESRPVVVVIEDLHWADDQTLRLLRFLRGPIAQSRVLLIGTCRPGSSGRRGRRSRWLLPEGGAGVDVLRLESISSEAVDDWLTATFGRCFPGQVISFVEDATDNHPVLLRSLLARLPRSWQGECPDRIGWCYGRLPAWLESDARSRLKGLPRATRDALATAAVAGREFSLDVLAGIEGWRDSLQAMTVLEPALIAELLEPASDWLMRLRFSDGLVRQTLYRGLRLQRRLEIQARLHAVLANERPRPVMRLLSR